jgi:uncharacterized membrane protein YeaQ/YmgE (transglycosylase-associated protein family)
MNDITMIAWILIGIFALATAIAFKQSFDEGEHGEALTVVVGFVGVLAVAAALTGCTEPVVNPVRYQVTEVLVTRPCFAVSQTPAPATVLTQPTCMLSREECVRAAQADIDELMREARQYRILFKGCTK